MTNIEFAVLLRLSFTLSSFTCINYLIPALITHLWLNKLQNISLIAIKNNSIDRV